MVESGTVLRARADLLVEELSGELIVLDPSNGDLHHLDRSAALVWLNLDGSDRKTLVDRLAALVSVDPARLEDEIVRTIQRFVELDLLERPDRG